MAGYVPGQQPANRSQEKEFVQAYEDVLERYKGAAAAGAGPGRGSDGAGLVGGPPVRGRREVAPRTAAGGRPGGSRPPGSRCGVSGRLIYRSGVTPRTPCSGPGRLPGARSLHRDCYLAQLGGGDTGSRLGSPPARRGELPSRGAGAGKPPFCAGCGASS